MKQCPECSEEIREEAVYCSRCGSLLKKQKKVKWYYKPLGLLFAFLCIGPFMLPLVWFNPALKPKQKIITSVIICVVSYLAIVYCINFAKVVMNHYQKTIETLNMYR